MARPTRRTSRTTPKGTRPAGTAGPAAGADPRRGPGHQLRPEPKHGDVRWQQRSATAPNRAFNPRSRGRS